MSNTLKFRLSVHNFLQSSIWGAWFVTLGTYLLETLHYTGTQVGLIYASTAIAALVSPFWIGTLADRHFAVERILQVLHGTGAFVLFLASQIEQFEWFYACILVYTCLYIPTTSLTTSLSFSHLEDPVRDYPPIRIWGTIGWIVIGVVVGSLQIEKEVTPIYFAVGLSAANAIFCSFLPHTPPPKQQHSSLKDFMGKEAKKILLQPNFLVLLVAMVFINIPKSFYYSFTNPFMNEIGISNAAGKMALGQVSEVFIILAMPFFLRHWGTKKVVAIGLLVWGLRYGLFALGDWLSAYSLVYFGIIIHGIAYCFTMFTGELYIDKNVPPHLKSTAQGLFVFLTLGLGTFIGSWIAGWLVEINTLPNQQHNWIQIWIFPTIIGILTAILFVISFKQKRKLNLPKL